KSSSGTPKNVAVAPPEAFLQSLQWQIAMKVGSVLNSNFTAPQAHCAVYFLLMSSTPCCRALTGLRTRRRQESMRDATFSPSKGRPIGVQSACYVAGGDFQELRPVEQRSVALGFASFRLDPDDERLWRGQQEVPLRRKPFAILRYLAEHPQRLVTR